MSKPSEKTWPSSEHTEHAEKLALKAACEVLNEVNFTDITVNEALASCLRAVCAIDVAMTQYHEKYLGNNYYQVLSSPLRILASAILASVQGMEADEVHPLCVASNSYIAFGKTCVMLEHLANAHSPFEDEDFQGAELADIAVRLLNRCAD